MADPLLISGSVVAAAAAAQAGWLAVDGFRRRFETRGRRRLETDLLAWRVEAARKRTEAIPDDAAWSGWRKFVVARRIAECDGICSFVLAPHDGRRLPAFRPGQYLTFQLPVPGRPKPVVRCYSLSDVVRPEGYRVSIKRQLPPPGNATAPPGVGSAFFHDHVKEGDILDVRAPSGNFCLGPDVRPAVFIGGGIGVTPLLAMLHGLASLEHPSPDAHLFLGLRSGGEHPFRQELARLAQEFPRLRQHVSYSQPRADDVQGRDFEQAGHLTIDVIRSVLPSNNFQFYICGPPVMMSTIVPALEQWGVPTSDIHYEAFGPASVQKVAAAGAAPAGTPAASSVEVVFERTGRTLAWRPEDGTVLDLAAANGISIDAGCRAGNCGTCAVAVKSGSVTYRTKPGVTVEQGTCLVCCSVPSSRLVLSA